MTLLTHQDALAFCRVFNDLAGGVVEGAPEPLFDIVLVEEAKVVGIAENAVCEYTAGGFLKQYNRAIQRIGGPKAVALPTEVLIIYEVKRHGRTIRRYLTHREAFDSAKAYQCSGSLDVSVVATIWTKTHHGGFSPELPSEPVKHGKQRHRALVR